MEKIPLQNVLEDAFGIGDITTPEQMDQLLARWDAEIEADEKAEQEAGKPKADSKEGHTQKP